MPARLESARRVLIDAARICLGAASGSAPHLGPFEIHLVSLSGARQTISERFRRACRAPELPGEGNKRDGMLPFSEDEQAILAALNDSALPLKVLIERTGIEKSKLATLAANLKARGVLETTDEGYKIRVEE